MAVSRSVTRAKKNPQYNEYVNPISGTTSSPYLPMIPPPPPRPSVSSPGLNRRHEENNDREWMNEETITVKPTSESTLEFKAWDVFRLLPPRAGDHKRGFWLDISLQLLKLITYPVVFVLLLASATATKATFLFMTSAIGLGGTNLTLCPDIEALGTNINSTVVLEPRHVVKYVWAVFLTLCAPEVFCFIRCLQRIFFRSVGKPSPGQFFTTMACETLVATGVGTLAFRILPELDAISGAMFMTSLCLLPSIFGLLSRKAAKLSLVLMVLDLISIVGQSSGMWALPIFVKGWKKHAWALPISGILCSLAFWENYVHKDSVFPCIRAMARYAETLKQVRSKTYVVVAPWKCLVYLCTLFAYMSLRMNVGQLLEPDPFGAKPIKVISYGEPHRFTANPHLAHDGATPSARIMPPTQLLNHHITNPLDLITYKPGTDNLTRHKRQIIYQGHDYVIRLFYTTPLDALWVFLITVLCGFFSYQCAKFACKVTMQRLCFALPLNLASLAVVFVLNALCIHRDGNACFFTKILPYEIFWKCPSSTAVQDFFTDPKTWFWFVWFLTQTWVTIHVWMPKCERLADTDRLFVLPWYNGLFIDQSLTLNRARDDTVKIKTEEIELEVNLSSSIYDTISTGVLSVQSFGMDTPSQKFSNTLSPKKSTDNITRIYACATMWHETREEMLCMLKSIFRLDEDQCARRNAQKYLKIVDPDYFEFEAHIMFDDAFEMNEYGEPIVNRFVRQLLEVIDIAAGAVHQITMRIKPPKKYASPYGGRLQWTLPGKNLLTVHLKDRNRIRVRKRWSQVMYMYYLLGHRLMERVGEIKRKETIAENTYILTLDGDVDFQPGSVQLLVDLMKKNRRLGAACGRIHPRGSGPMVWYQKFEYAIGHWFQKATEHMIGCVLCSPGCFSLFRSSALMDDNVLRRYATKAEKAQDYIQYDQGEDRWLCTLLLQRGYRVEYSAASDALTFAPQSFTEFFNQRRRWVPSTIANILDLLADYKNVVKLNDSISIWYIIYQFAMLLSSVLGPGTIFLMVAGAVNISFTSSTTLSFVFVLLPVLLFMLVCFTCKPTTQLIVAQVISAWFAMLMMAVIVGTALQIKKDGITSPHAIFMMCLICSAFVAACLHPLEFTCIIPGVLYFLAIPCTYMLMAVYSVCNLHVVSWGTREVITKDEVTEKRKQKDRSLHVLENGEPLSAGEIDGAYSLGCGSACRLLCCIKPSLIAESPQLAKLTEQIDQMDRKLERMDRRFVNRKSSLGINDGRMDAQPLLEALEDEMADDNFDLPYHQAQKDKAALSDSWLNDRCMRHAERDWLENEEDKFWIDLIDKYLYPVKKVQNQDQVVTELGSLRNQIAFGFYMTNALFILVVFLLQLKKDCLNVEWPLGEKQNRSVVPCNSDSGEPEYAEVGLQLEPIGFVFLFFFMSLLVIQFIAMLLHRFGTLSHILASTELFCYRKRLDRLSEEELVAEHFVEIAKELQAIRGVDDDSNDGAADDDLVEGGANISRRQVVKRLEESSRRQQAARRTDTLDAAFRKRFFNLKEEEENKLCRRLTMKQDTIRAVRSRRDKIYGTLDKATGNKLNGQLSADEEQDSMAGHTSNARGPSRRRVDRIFNERNGDVTSQVPSNTTKDHSSSDSEPDSEFKIVEAGKVNPSALRHKDSWGEPEYGSVTRSGIKGLPLRKMIAQNALNDNSEASPKESKRQLLARMGASTESETSLDKIGNGESRF